MSLSPDMKNIETIVKLDPNTETGWGVCACVHFFFFFFFFFFLGQNNLQIFGGCQATKHHLTFILFFSVLFCSLIKGITPKICRLCFCPNKQRPFEPFTCLGFVLKL